MFLFAVEDGILVLKIVFAAFAAVPDPVYFAIFNQSIPPDRCVVFVTNSLDYILKY